MVKDLSENSPRMTSLKLIRRSSGSTLTSGLTPVPFNNTDTIVCSEYKFILSSKTYLACGSNCTTTGFVSPGFIILIAFSTEKPPNGVSAYSYSYSSMLPTFFIKISYVFLKATGISPKSISEQLATRVLYTVVVRTYKYRIYASADSLSVFLK